MLAVVLVETVALALLGLLVAGLLRSHADILRRLHALDGGDQPARGPVDVPFGVQPGVPAPPGVLAGRDIAGFATGHDVSGTSPYDETVAVAVLGVRHRTLLAFLSSGCATCAGFWSAFAVGAHHRLPADTRLVVVAKDAAEESEARLRELAPPDVPVVLSSAAWRDYAVPVAPYVVCVDGPTGQVVGEGAAASWQQVVGLWLQAGTDGGHGLDGAGREARADRELRAAGIHPEHPSLRPDSPAALAAQEAGHVPGRAG